jgi:hypothetical protein
MLQSGGESLLILERFASVRVALKFMEDLTEFDKQANEAGTTFDFPSVCVWPRLLSERLTRVLGVWSLTWQNVVAKIKAMPINKWTWAHEGKGASFMSSESILLNVQLLMSARLPSIVQKSEVANILPLAEDARFADCLFECCGFGQQPFVLAAQAAQHVGLGLARDSIQYLRAALVRHANPVKQHHAHCLLGELHS